VGKIAILPPAVQGQIAAGEVVERPASVVKELVENALDAGARHVEVRLAAGGLDLIAVRDDGEGMAPEDALTSFARHATSKLARAEDLARVVTLGFRGEALPSIAAVARVRLLTRRADDASAVAVEADAGGARAAGAAGAPPGTSVEVRGLFAETPARRKFLRAAPTEVGHAVDALVRIAVAHPAVGFRLEHDGREVLALPPVRDPRQRLVQALGRERAAELAPLEAAGGGYRVTGFLAPPRETLASARLVWTYVALGSAGAARWVRDRLLLRAVLDGYESLLLRGRYPIAVLFVGVPSGEVDVNVHPAKLEVRFRQPAAIHQLIVPALRARLRAGLAPGVPAAPGHARGVGEAPPVYTPGGAKPAGEPVQAGLWTPAPRGFASLRFIGQIFDGYLLCEGEGRVVLIDQHAAHERVVFERLQAEQRAGGIARDPLLIPEAVELRAPEAAALAEHAALLAAAGLEGEPFGEGAFLLRTVPRLLRGRDVGALLRALAVELVEEGASGAAERATDAVLATVACHGVVRVGQRLERAEVDALLSAMDGVEVAAHCPHGRPVAAELGRAQLEALFRR
jgi:DNA mismatch repair protein MutL